jgi:hypothetical protein
MRPQSPHPIKAEVEYQGSVKFSSSEECFLVATCGHGYLAACYLLLAALSPSRPRFDDDTKVSEAPLSPSGVHNGAVRSYGPGVLDGHVVWQQDVTFGVSEFVVHLGEPLGVRVGIGAIANLVMGRDFGRNEEQTPWARRNFSLAAGDDSGDSGSASLSCTALVRCTISRSWRSCWVRGCRVWPRIVN